MRVVDLFLVTADPEGARPRRVHGAVRHNDCNERFVDDVAWRSSPWSDGAIPAGADALASVLALAASPQLLKPGSRGRHAARGAVQPCTNSPNELLKMVMLTIMTV
jgi:hypothetical protein